MMTAKSVVPRPVPPRRFWDSPGTRNDSLRPTDFSYKEPCFIGKKTVPVLPWDVGHTNHGIPLIRPLYIGGPQSREHDPNRVPQPQPSLIRTPPTRGYRTQATKQRLPQRSGGPNHEPEAKDQEPAPHPDPTRHTSRPRRHRPCNTARRSRPRGCTSPVAGRAIARPTAASPRRGEGSFLTKNQK